MKLVLALALLVFPARALAQDYRASILYAAPADTAASLAFAPRDSFEVPKQPSIAWPLAGGAVGAFAGMVGGLALGASMDPYADEITSEMAYGFVAGEILFLPLGVHLGNGRKGNFLADLAVSAVIGTAAVLITSASNDEFPLILGAAAQYGAVVVVERSTAKSKIARATILARDAAIAAGPDSAGVDSMPPFHAPPLPEVEQPSLGWPIAVGVAAGIAGGVAGAAIGDTSDDSYTNTGDISDGAVLGYFIGETLSMPLGVHLGNARNGSFAGDLGLSLLGHVASIGIGSFLGGGAGYLVGMAGTVALTVANERKVGKRRLQEAASTP